MVTDVCVGQDPYLDLDLECEGPAQAVSSLTQSKVKTKGFKSGLN